jgi:predicted anti-sigma-YlaC factor YlaD
MNCEDVKELLVDSLLGELDTLEEITVNEHLLTCQECQRELEETESFLKSLECARRSTPDKRVFEKITQEMKYRSQYNPFTFLKKPVKLYHAIVSLLIGVLIMSVITFIVTTQRSRPVERKEEYKTRETSPPSDSIIFYTAPSHRLGGS